jgi:phosphatidylglycerophosphate synthase
MAKLTVELAKTKLGEGLQKGADLLCYARLAGSAAIASYNLTSDEPRSWWSALAVGANYSTDAADGRLARLGAKWRGLPTSNDGKKLDQEVDKKAHYLITVSQMLDAERRGESGFAAGLLVSLLTQVARDNIVNNKRQRADKVSSLTGMPIHIGSLPSSKRKMVVIDSVDTAIQSPIADNAAGRVLLSMAHVTGTMLSLSSGAEVVAQLDEGLIGIQNSLPADFPDRQQIEGLSRLMPTERALMFIGKVLT